MTITFVALISLGLVIAALVGYLVGIQVGRDTTSPPRASSSGCRRGRAADAGAPGYNPDAWMP